MADDYDLPRGTLMGGKKGLVLGVANHQSLAWGIAAQLAAQGAELALAGAERLLGAGSGVVEGFQKLRDGMPVAPKTYSAATADAG